MYRVRFTEQADSDLFNIYLYTYKTWGVTQADKYTDGLREAIAFLAQEPGRPGTVDCSALRPGYRSYHHQRHLIFYRVVKDALEIIRILHDSMDVPRHLSAQGEEES